MTNETYLAWVRNQPSCLSGRIPCEPHHIIGNGRYSTRRTSDLWAIPLTPDEHRQLHDLGWREWEARYGSQVMLALETLTRAVEQGFFAKSNVPTVALWPAPVGLKIATKRKTKIDLRTRKVVKRESTTASPSKCLPRR